MVSPVSTMSSTRMTWRPSTGEVMSLVIWTTPEDFVALP